MLTQHVYSVMLYLVYTLIREPLREKIPWAVRSGYGKDLSNPATLEAIQKIQPHETSAGEMLVL
jgi:hypothetical protein